MKNARMGFNMDLKRYTLLLNVFFAGFVIMALEIIGIRILASVFGYSIFVWGGAIGIVLVSLTVGYWIGGIIADRTKTAITVYLIILFSVLYLSVVIFLYSFILKYFSNFGHLEGLIFASIVLLVPPSMALSMVPPIATKLLLKKREEGKTIGNVYAISNLGSILGTFATTFYLAPFFGSKATLLYCTVFMALLILAGFLVEKAMRKKLLSLFILSAILLASPVMFPEDKGRYTLVKVESIYNTIEIKEQLGTRWLLLNGYAMSYLEKEPGLSINFYDAIVVFPEIVEAKDMLILGFATGTIATKIERFFPDVKISGVEIDPEVVRLAREYFELRESDNIKVYVDDARHFIQTCGEKYDIIFNNAINAKFIPFHLVTKEFFELCASKLNKSGVMINYSFYNERGTMLRDSIAKTMCEVFPSVYYLDFPEQGVCLVFGFKQKISKEEFIEKINKAKGKNTNENVQNLIDYFKNIREVNCVSVPGEIVTDDKNPIDNITLMQII